ncbi:MAG: oxidoreductase [Anaerolineales bacterium]
MPAGVPLTALTAGQPVTITQIHMFDAAVGWGIGYQRIGESHILRTADGGETWQDASPPVGDSLLFDPAALFQDAQSAWAAYPIEVGHLPLVWRTSDGGISWSGAPLPVGTDAELFDPSFFALDGNQIWLLVTTGAGMQHAYSDLFTSLDGGLSWERLADPFMDGASDLMLFPHTGMAFKGATGWVTKENGVMDGIYWAASSDGGSTWMAQTPPPPAGGNVMCSTYAPVLFSPDAGAYLTVCWDYQADTRHAYFTAVENGQTQFVPLPVVVGGLQFFSPQQGLAFGCWNYQLPDPLACQILSTGDGGQTWTHVKTVNWDGDFWFADPQNGWAVARNGAEMALVRTVDGGLTWQLLHPIVTAP